MKKVQTHMDEIDAVQAGEKWLDALCQRRGADAAEMNPGTKPGGIRTAWKGRRLLGYYITVRDSLNWTVLACHDLSPDLDASNSVDADNIKHLTECCGCTRCSELKDIYIECDGCGAWNHKDSAHNYIIVNGETLCTICQNKDQPQS